MSKGPEGLAQGPYTGHSNRLGETRARTLPALQGEHSNHLATVTRSRADH